MKQKVREKLNEGIKKPPVDEGIIKQTWLLEDAVVQVPEMGEKWRVPKIQLVAEKALEQGVRTPEPIDGRFEEPSYLVLERSEGESLRSLSENEIPDEEIIKNYGAELAKVHQCPGENYGYPVKETELIGSHQDWTGFVKERINQTLDYVEGTSYELPARVTAAAIEPEDLPSPEPRLLHGDYSSDNVIVDPETSQVSVIDWDDSLLGDPKFEYVQTRYLVDRHWGAKNKFEEGYRGVNDFELDKLTEDNYLALTGLFESRIGAFYERNSTLDPYEVSAQELLEEFQTILPRRKILA